MTVYTDENMKSNEGLTNFAFETKDEPGTDQQDTKSGETSTASLEASTMSLENGAVNESESNIDSDRSNLSLNNNSRRDAVLRVNSHISESEKRRVKPPRRGVMASLWGCLGVKQTPSIKHTAGSNGVSKLEPDLPMPAEDELNRLFAEFVEELDLDRAHRKAMFDLADDKKWQIYCSKRKEQDDTAGLPDQYIEQIESLAANNILLVAGHESNEEAKQSFFDTLRTALRTQPLKFVITFINKGGLDSLLKYLSKMDYETLKTNVHSNVLACIKSLMNNDQGRSHVLAHPEAINIISQSLASDNIRAKISCIEILGAMCLVPGGHKKVLAAMLYFQKYAAERARFQTILNDLDRSSVVYKDRDELALKSTILSFINATLKYGSGQNSLEFRMHLRFEFLMLGLQTIIEKLKKLENSSLNKHIEFFELIRNVDDKEFSKRFDLLHVDTRSATSMFELLRKRLHVSTSYGHLLSILKHLLLLPNQTKGTQYWSLIDRLVQQVCLQQPDGSNPDIELAEIDVSKVVRLAQESEVKSVQGQMRTIQKENDELMRQLNKKERECEAKTEEKDEVMGTLNDMKAKLEKEAAEVVTLTQTINTLQAQLLAEQQERQKLQEYVKTGNLPDDTKVGAMLSSSLPAITPPGGAPPPPPPGPGMPPPPPPPGPPGAPPPPGMMMKTAPKQKKVPKSSIPLKSFNWQKIGADKTANTVFDGLQDELVYKEVDLQDFEQQFSGYQHKDGSDKIVKHESKELSLIDGRRAQNCTILLSKLKMTSEELRKAILSVDHSEELAKDMVEQLLKFVPTQEETQMLTEHEDKKDTMARADRFLLDICKVPHYEQRLNALYYKKKFSDRMGDVKPKVTDLLDASKQLYSSKRIKHLFEIVLAYGNYMNKGNRGNAFGFKISSLNKIADTKSSQSREFNMLNYLLQLFHSQFRDLLQLENEIGKVKDAKRIALPELTKEVSKMGKELKEIGKEIIYQKNHKTGDPHDRFVQVMSDFVTVASYKYSELESKFKEALEKFHKVVTYFGEDKDKAVPDEFFSVFSDFLDAMSFAEAENRRQLLKKKEEEKRALNEAQMKAERDRKAAEKRTQKNKTSGKSAGKTGSKSGKEEPVEAGGEFDDLISALTNGQVYEDHLNNMSNKKTTAGRKRVARQPSREDNSQASAFKSKYAQPVVR